MSLDQFPHNDHLVLLRDSSGETTAQRRRLLWQAIVKPGAEARHVDFLRWIGRMHAQFRHEFPGAGQDGFDAWLGAQLPLEESRPEDDEERREIA